MVAREESDSMPVQGSMVSMSLSSCLNEAGVGCLLHILENAGICSCACLCKLNEEELAEICQRVRAAGFGPGHVRSLRELCRSAGKESERKLEADFVCTPKKYISDKLQGCLERKGLERVKAVLSQSGVQSFACLGKLASRELEEVIITILAMGFDQIHAQALRELHCEARSESGSVPLCGELRRVGNDMSSTTTETVGVSSLIERKPELPRMPELTRMMSPRRTRRSWEELEAQADKSFGGDDCGSEQRPTKLTKHSMDSRGGGHPSQASARSSDATSRVGEPMMALTDVADRFVSIVEDFTVQSFAPLKPELHRALLAVQEFQQAFIRTGTDVKQEEPSQSLSSHTSSLGLSKIETKIETTENYADSTPGYVTPKVESCKEEIMEDALQKMFDSRPANLYCRKSRMCRQGIMDNVSSTKAMAAKVIRYRDRASGAMLEARVPDVVLALLQLHASCSGKEVSEQRLARMAMDVMEEQAYDPIRAVASLSPGSLLCPSSAMRVLGSGFIGIVFLEEDSGEVVKVMLEDFAKKEYEVFVVFANAGIAPRPLSFSGPVIVPGGQLFSIRMQKVPFLLHQVLCRKEPKGVRHGFAPPSEKITARIASKLVATLQCMWDKGLIHGDLHLNNVGLQDANAEMPLLLLDFGRSSNNGGKDDPVRIEAARAGHEYDVYRLVLEMCEAFDEQVEEWQLAKKECEKELRELKRTKAPKETDEDYQLHHNRQIVGLQAFLAEEPQSLEQVEQVYTTLVTAVMKYANAKFGLPYDGVPCVRSRRLRQNCTKLQKAAYQIYFKSDLFWDEIVA